MFARKSRFAAAIAFLLLLFVSLSFAQKPQSARARVRTFDVQHYIVRVSFDRANKIVFGDATVRLKPLANDFKTLELDAANLKFDSVNLENENKNLKYKTSGEKIFVSLDRTYAAGEAISVRFKYAATKPKKGVYFIDARSEKGKIVRDAQIWSQGEAAEAHFWFPCYDSPDDKATSEEFITIGADETAVGNGELIETIENGGGTRTFHYKLPVAHSSYLISFVVGKYAKYTDVYKNVPLDFYVYARDSAALGFTVPPGGKTTIPTVFVRTKEMMRVYEELTGVDYPFNKYDQIIAANFNLGGMENITATTFADVEIIDANAGNALDLVAHELAHSWFGNLATCADWSELWLNEGFATYMEAAYREKIFGRDDYQRAIRENALQFMTSDAVYHSRRGLFYAAARADDRLFDDSNAPITYNKAGAVIHILRETVGTENFWKATNIYLNRHKFQTVGSEDLRRAMEETSNQELDWFFAQWVYGAGYPKLSVRQTYDANAKTLNLTVEQTQKADGSTVAAFRLPLSVQITTAAGTIVQKIEINRRIQNFPIKTDGEPTNIILDAEGKIPLKTVKYLR